MLHCSADRKSLRKQTRKEVIGTSAGSCSLTLTIEGWEPQAGKPATSLRASAGAQKMGCALIPFAWSPGQVQDLLAKQSWREWPPAKGGGKLDFQGGVPVRRRRRPGLAYRYCQAPDHFYLGPCQRRGYRAVEIAKAGVGHGGCC